MKNRFLAIFLCIVILVVGGCAASKKPITPNKTNDKTLNTTNKKTTPKTKKLHVTGFAMNEKGKLDPQKSLERYGKNINEISPLWYSVMKDGSVRDKTDKTMLAYAKKHKIDVVALVNVAKSNDTVLTNKTIRDRAITQIVGMVKKYDLDGVNIDFEFIPEGTESFVKDKDLMTEFISILSKKIPPKKHIDICVIPQLDVPEEISGIYDYKKLSPLIDHVTLMLYDKHQVGSNPGPIAPQKWVEENVKEALKAFKPNQICMGVATYGYDWPAAKSGGFSSPTKEILDKAGEVGVKVKWSDQYHEPYYIYRDPDSGKDREVWFENNHTLKDKIKIAKKYNLFGICIWRLGFETPSFWDVIKKDIR